MDSVCLNEDAISKSISHVPPSHYILKIESFSLLTGKEVEKYESGEFEVGGYKWKLVLYPSGNKRKNVKDHISLYLSIADTSLFSFGWEVYVVYRLFLFDHNQDKYLILQDAMGKERRFHGLKPEWGFDQFIPLKDFKDCSKGYLVEDTCVFGVEVFVKERNPMKGECLSMIQNKSSSKYVWQIRNFSKLETEQESEVFTAGDHKWKIRLYPKGDDSARGRHLSVFLVLADSRVKKIYTNYKLSILSQVFGGKNKTFNAEAFVGALGSGCSEFVKLSDIEYSTDGFLVNDMCTVEVELTVLGICNSI
ncbi:Ubiquitin carboxyl-terminal hydrolase 12 [Melia azedarach]|uniref:Ubiquitin carboxyl-terminal hydrolase 12 n=1 Tax=Melia azedarach TaxID=155640 RepID=A0ACC1XVQ9_MELAZ|nr:Ubiquitin carboxyl-terminal hydrolase 12 [Melia azedarach]